MKKTMYSELSQGVIVPIITPYHFSEIFPLVDWIIQGGVSKIFLLGTTGEALTLPHNTKVDLIKKMASYLGDKAELLVGITSLNLNESMELMDVAHSSGAIASVIAPLVLGLDCTSTIEKLLSSCPGKLLLYNHPGITKDVSIPIQQMEPFFSEKRILGVKDSSADFTYLDQLLKTKENSHFMIFYGSEHHLAETLEKNLDGWVPASGNIEPELTCRLWQQKAQGPWKQWIQLKAVIKEKDSGNYIFGIKQLLKESNLISDARLYS